MSRFTRTFAVTSVLAVLLAACSGTNGATTPTEPAPPATTDAPDPSDPNDPNDSGADIAVFFVRSEPTRFFVEPEYQSGGDPNLGPVAATSEALTRLFAASDPTDPAAPKDPDLFTSVPEGITLNSVTIDGDTITVDVSGFAGTSGASAQEATMLLQLAHTATYAAGVTTVQLLFDGATQDELWGHFDVSDPIEVSVFDLSPVTIVDPAYGDSVPVGDVTFFGEALVFEATVTITLINADTGATAYTGFVNATAGGPERGTWEWTHTFTEPGTYTLQAGETDPSDGEGRPPYIAYRTIVVG